MVFGIPNWIILFGGIIIAGTIAYSAVSREGNRGNRNRDSGSGSWLGGILSDGSNGGTSNSTTSADSGSSGTSENNSTNRSTYRGANPEATESHQDWNPDMLSGLRDRSSRIRNQLSGTWDRIKRSESEIEYLKSEIEKLRESEKDLEQIKRRFADDHSISEERREWIVNLIEELEGLADADQKFFETMEYILKEEEEEFEELVEIEELEEDELKELKNIFEAEINAKRELEEIRAELQDIENKVNNLGEVVENRESYKEFRKDKILKSYEELSERLMNLEGRLSRVDKDDLQGLDQKLNNLRSEVVDTAEELEKLQNEEKKVESREISAESGLKEEESEIDKIATNVEGEIDGELDEDIDVVGEVTEEEEKLLGDEKAVQNAIKNIENLDEDQISAIEDQLNKAKKSEEELIDELDFLVENIEETEKKLEKFEGFAKRAEENEDDWRN